MRYSAWLGWDFHLPVPGVYSEGQLAGRLQVVNIEGGLDASGLAGAVLRANGLRVSVDPSGEFLFPPLPPGEYELTLDAQAVYQPLVAFPLTATVERGKETYVEIPVRAMSRLAGRVEVAWANANGSANGSGNGFYPDGNGFGNGNGFVPNGNGLGNGNGLFPNGNGNGNGWPNGNGSYRNGNGNGWANGNGIVNGNGLRNGNGRLGNIEVEFWREGVLVAWTRTDSLGFYESPLLEPGLYMVRLAPHTLPRGLMPAEDAGEEPIYLAPGQSYRKDLAVWPRPLRLRLDFEAEEP